MRINLGNFIKKNWYKNHTIIYMIAWTILLLFSTIWNLEKNKKSTIEKALIEARTISQHNLAYRRWNTFSGGVYARISEFNKENDYLPEGIEKTIKTTDGTELTLVNPFQMTKQVYALLKKQTPLPTINRTVSDDPLSPDNETDEWESRGISLFEKGIQEVYEIMNIKGESYLRLLTPYITERGCMKCHGYQGYDIGDIRGGMSIAVPMRPYYLIQNSNGRIIIVTHLLIWFFGSGLLVLFSKGIKKYQDDLTEKERKFRIVTDFAYDFETWISKDKKIEYISPSCERITGYNREEFERNPDLLTDIIYIEDSSIYDNHHKQFNDLVHEEIEYRIVTKSGEIRWLSHICSPIFQDGNFLGRRASSRDITEKKKLESQLFRSQKMESLGLFAGGIAHDFNNILTSITGFTELLDLDISYKTDNIREYIKQINNAANLGKNLTSNLLAFGKKQITKKQNVYIYDVVNNMKGIIKTLISEDIELVIEITENEKPVYADRHQLEQILINLVTNAGSSMPKGGRLIIKTDTFRTENIFTGNCTTILPGNYMLLTVSDTGTGINDENMNKIFEPFFSTRESTKGTGLGLSIIYNIVSNHYGYIDVKTKTGEGSTFMIYIPEGDAIPVETVKSMPMRKAVPHDRGKFILIAEDDKPVRRFISNYLGRRGYYIITANDGDEAVTMFKGNKDLIDLVILDVVMPGKNGKVVYGEIKKLKPEIKVLFISGHTDDILSAKGIEQESLEFMQKPLEPTTFLAKVEELLFPN
jgi:PAS domain S-box-containing protein